MSIILPPINARYGAALCFKNPAVSQDLGLCRLFFDWFFSFGKDDRLIHHGFRHASRLLRLNDNTWFDAGSATTASGFTSSVVAGMVTVTDD